MCLLGWINCSASIAFMITYFTSRVNGNDTVAHSNLMRQVDNNCHCYDPDGRIYNLAPLERNDGKPRLTKPGANKYEFSYNPCRSFSLGPPQTSYCYGDVAICMWTANPESYRNIGRQSSMRCGFDRQTMTPQLEYTYAPATSIVKLKCNPTRITTEDAKFDVIDDRNNTRVFQVTHNCACPDGCPPDDATPAELLDKELLRYMLPFGALSVLSVVGPLVIYCYQKRQDRKDNEQQPLNRGENEQDNVVNQFNNLNEGRIPVNEENGPQPPLQSASSRHDVTISNKHNLNATKYKYGRYIGAFA